ncbi:hypothetical protein [Desulfobulbus alkaliphilus]|uniref:hypothetical protein n=1 Tax=Desulfobulbus alkaliphilus TaxID=869814 RepID=UPI001966CD0F|nr:hypothetical protein [Desulfobulbus alkaliphilus]MBM9537093.1 hypothetical protein [Desulfobulbus alkaliphilus]
MLVVVGLVDFGQAASKNLMVTPIRAVFTDRQRAVEVRVSNLSDESITYAISLVSMRRDAEGQLYQVEDEMETEEERLVKDMIRFSPRRATIKPREQQSIKLMVRKPQDLPPGEYQTRLSISPLEDPAQGQATLSGIRADEHMTFLVDVLVTSTIPVIIQHGDIAPEVTPIALTLPAQNADPENLRASVRLGRHGEGSAFGRLVLRYLPADNPRAERQVGHLEGIVLYRPETEREYSVPMHNVSSLDLSSGTIRVEFLPDSVGRGQAAAIKDFPLP